MKRSEKDTSHIKLQSLKLIRSLVHDLKNPLTVALGNMQLLQMRVDDLEGKNKNLITNGVKAIYQQLGLLDNIADYAKIEANMHTYTPASVNVDILIQSELKLSREEESSKEYVFIVDESHKLVLAEEKLLTRAIHKIIKHIGLNTNSNSQVVVKSYIDLLNRVKYIEFEDDGELLIGKNFESIFDVLSEVNLDDKNGRYDSNISLGVASIFLRHMRGDIIAVDNGGTGAKFVINLPISPDN